MISSFRIIPARAGFTVPASPGALLVADHPRSRGVYERGGVRLGAGAGIIPARAGFTASRRPGSQARRDHPRSRGVYHRRGGLFLPMGGSSPLARGLRLPVGQGQDGLRIIPARAGFTSSSRPVTRPSPDHPRSRGVYGQTLIIAGATTGSSPLARGLPPGGSSQLSRARIIPARAGFTTCRVPTRSRRWDHPRSRGVYLSSEELIRRGGGSSPLARGLLDRRPVRADQVRIIPARAGFTRR